VWNVCVVASYKRMNREMSYTDVYGKKELQKLIVMNWYSNFTLMLDFLLEQNVFNITLKIFDDNKVLKKLSIGYVNICSTLQDHRQKI